MALGENVPWEVGEKNEKYKHPGQIPDHGYFRSSFVFTKMWLFLGSSWRLMLVCVRVSFSFNRNAGPTILGCRKIIKNMLAKKKKKNECILKKTCLLIMCVQNIFHCNESILLSLKLNLNLNEIKYGTFNEIEFVNFIQFNSIQFYSISIKIE